MRIDIDIVNVDFNEFISECAYNEIYVETTADRLIFYPQQNIEAECFVDDSNFSCDNPIVNFNKEFGFEYIIQYDMKNYKYKFFDSDYPNTSIFPIIKAILNYVDITYENNNPMIELDSDDLYKLNSVIEIETSYKHNVENVKIIMDYKDIDKLIDESFN